MIDKSAPVLVTGASSGLGAAMSTALSEIGFTVYAGVRSAEAADRISRPRICPVILDVTLADSVREAGSRIAAETAGIGLHGLVNNAGICVSAPVECLPLDDLRAELEVNLIGAVATIQQFLPLLRHPAPGTPDGGPAGRIVNVSSGIGRIAPPFLGAYAASQFAKEGVSDVLRRELATQSVSVSVLEPGAVPTPIWSKVDETAMRLFDGAPRELADLYRNRFLAFLSMNADRAQRSRTRPETVARAVVHAMTARRPRIRYAVGTDSRIAAAAARLIPDRVMDAAIARQFAASATTADERPERQVRS
ncbi:MAG: SDR family NAD(P)-dependent oxidoreductase [Dermatophilaceae bacterium]